MASTAEREIRNSVVDKIRALRPGSRVIHELNTAGTGSCRADIAAIGLNEILLFEIKSEKDVLKRLAKQREAFEACSHQTFYILDKKFFDTSQIINIGSDFLDPGPELKEILGAYFIRDNIWHYPEPRKDEFYHDHSWKLNAKKTRFTTPSARVILNMLWAEELKEVCRNTDIPYKSKDNMFDLTERLVLGLTGRAVVEQVCHMLRKRSFSEADDAME